MSGYMLQVANTEENMAILCSRMDLGWSTGAETEDLVEVEFETLEQLGEMRSILVTDSSCPFPL